MWGTAEELPGSERDGEKPIVPAVRNITVRRMDDTNRMRILDPRNNRGIALLIVLLVTALLIALVFEFAYATRISLNSAMNYRDGERAYFLALTGINAFKASGQNLRDMFPAGQWQPVPLMTDTDTQIMLKW